MKKTLFLLSAAVAIALVACDMSAPAAKVASPSEAPSSSPEKVAVAVHGDAFDIQKILVPAPLAAGLPVLMARLERTGGQAAGGTPAPFEPTVADDAGLRSPISTIAKS